MPGVFDTLYQQALTFGPKSRTGRAVRNLAARGDTEPDCIQPTGAVWTLEQYLSLPDTTAPATCKYSFSGQSRLGVPYSFSTDWVGYNHSTAMLTNAINDAASAAGVTDWEPGAIVVGGAVDRWNGDVTLTFSGEAVKFNPVTVTANYQGFYVATINGYEGLFSVVQGNDTDTSEVHRLADWLETVTGTFDLIFSLEGDAGTIEFTVSDIAFDITAANLQTAIDSAAVAAGYTAWSGEIVVTGGPLTSAYMDLTFGDGLLKQYANHDTTDTDMSGISCNLSGIVTDPTLTTANVGYRPAWGVLYALGIVTVPIPPIGQAGTVAHPVYPGGGTKRIQPWLVKELAAAAAHEDNDPTTYHAILEVLRYDDDCPLITVR